MLIISLSGRGIGFKTLYEQPGALVVSLQKINRGAFKKLFAFISMTVQLFLESRSILAEDDSGFWLFGKCGYIICENKLWMFG